MESDLGQGERTRISLKEENGMILLKIDNDGACENQRTTLTEDLLTMRSLIYLVGGSLELRSDAAFGTHLIAVIPEIPKNLD